MSGGWVEEWAGLTSGVVASVALVALLKDEVIGRSPFLFQRSSLAKPFKFHDARRHHIPKAKYQLLNWPAYNAGLCRRGSITL